MVDPGEKGVGIQEQSATLQVNFLFSVHSFTSAKIIIVFSLIIIIKLSFRIWAVLISLVQWMIMAVIQMTW